MNSDHMPPFEPPPSPRPGDLGPVPEGYERGVKPPPMPADGTMISLTNAACHTSFFVLSNARERDAKRSGLTWSAFASFRGANSVASIEVECEPRGRVRVSSRRSGATFFHGAPTHAPIGDLPELGANLPEPGCIFYDLEG